MAGYLVFRLYGPLASWGDIAVGEMRPSTPHPSKSAVMGLVAAALGIRRDQEDELSRLAGGYGMAVRVDGFGKSIKDYHTIQVRPGQNSFATRRDELAVERGEKLETILSYRDYRTDALFTIALWERSNPPYSFERLKEALEKPVFTLYLGRKSCPLGTPLEPQVVQAGTIREAIQKAEFKFLEVEAIPGKQNPMLYWEKNENAGLEPQQAFERRDIPLSRKRWQFDTRLEYYAPW
jgi:CRISPR system Cascade subunit CasD